MARFGGPVLMLGGGAGVWKRRGEERSVENSRVKKEKKERKKRRGA